MKFSTSLRRTFWLSLPVVVMAGAAVLAPLSDRPPLRGSATPDEADVAPGQYLAGRFAMRQYDWHAAAKFMGVALDADPEDLPLLRRTFLLMLGDGRYEDAVSIAQRLVVREPGALAAHMLLVAADAAAGRWDAATARLRSVPGDGLAKVAVPLLSAWLTEARGEHKPALSVLEQLQETMGALHAFHAALLSEVAGDMNGAAHWYEEALRRGGGGNLRVVQGAASLLQRSGRDADALALRTSFAQENSDGPFFDTSALMDEADLRSRPPVGSAQDGLAETMLDLASALHQESQEEQAVIYARIALLLRPALPSAWLLISDVLANRGHHEQALAALKEAEKDEIYRWSVRLRVADSLARSDQTAEAVKQLEAMAAENETRTDPLIRLADLQRSNKHYPEAIEAYTRVLARLPQLEERHWTILFGRAAALERSNRWPEAEKDILKAMELSRDQALLLNFLGYSWVDKGVHIPEAKAMIERAVALRPKDGYIIDSLGWALFRLADTKGAITHLERAIELKPLDPTINDHLGDAYWAAGRRTEALFQWRRSLQNAEDEPELAVAVRKKIDERSRLTGSAFARP